LEEKMFILPKDIQEDTRPPKISPKIVSAPKVRQVYWCDFPNDAHLPEFWKCRPVVIISRKATLHGKITILPFSTKPQPNNPFAHSLNSPIDGQPTWIICDHMTTLATSRLSPTKGKIGSILQQDYLDIMKLAFTVFPQLEK
jgi:mRNA interferase MazF